MEMTWIIGPAIIVAAYVCGSFASAIIVCRSMGLPDPRSGGSGNPGATNVLRIGGKFPAAMTLAGDVAKGIVPVAAARALDCPAPIIIGAGLAAFIGHLFPIFFRFQGGKGVATAFGMVLMLDWVIFLGMGVTWLAVAAAFRYSSLASLCAGVAAPVTAVLIDAPGWYVFGLVIVAVLLLWRHKGNIERLRVGNESRIGQKG